MDKKAQEVETSQTINKGAILSNEVEEKKTDSDKPKFDKKMFLAFALILIVVIIILCSPKGPAKIDKDYEGDLSSEKNSDYFQPYLEDANGSSERTDEWSTSNKDDENWNIEDGSGGDESPESTFSDITVLADDSTFVNLSDRDNEKTIRFIDKTVKNYFSLAFPEMKSVKLIAGEGENILLAQLTSGQNFTIRISENGEAGSTLTTIIIETEKGIKIFETDSKYFR